MALGRIPLGLQEYSRRVTADYALILTLAGFGEANFLRTGLRVYWSGQILHRGVR
jgi:hypothetical protein